MSDHTDSVWYNEHIRRWVRQDPDGSAGFVVISGECDAPKPVTYSDTVEPDVFKRLANILTHDSTTPGSYVSVSLFEIGEILTAVRTLEAEVERLKGEKNWWKGECNTAEGWADRYLKALEEIRLLDPRKYVAVGEPDYCGTLDNAQAIARQAIEKGAGENG